MIKQFFKLMIFVLAAFAGGIFGSRAWPNLAANLGDKIQPSVPAPIIEKTQITIQENKALKDAVAKVGNTVLAIKSTNTKGGTVFGAGLILTSDGLAVALSSVLPANSTMEVLAGGKKAAFQITKRAKGDNLALLKIEDSNLPTASFYAPENLKIGERVFLAGITPAGGNFVNEGIVRDFDADSISTNIIEKPEANGSPVFDIEGNIMGIASLDKSGRVVVIPISKIKIFSEL